MCYEEKDVIMRQKLEEEMLEFAKGYKLLKWEIPALIDGNTLKKCGYFKTMPNQLTTVCSIKEQEIWNVIRDNEVELKDIKKSNYYLTPAACLHIYPMLEENPQENTIITTRAHVYRYEDAKFERGKRLWEFTVREFVAVGMSDFVQNFLRDFQQKSIKLCEKKGMDCRLMVSNDLFYPSRENIVMQKMQRANKMKVELIIDCEQKNIALASYNYHGTHFSKSFHFDKDGTIVTGCVGFGLDRWTNCLKILGSGEYETADCR